MEALYYEFKVAHKSDPNLKNIYIYIERSLRKNNKNYIFFKGMKQYLWGKSWPEPTVCPGSSDPPEKILNIFASENEVYTIF